MRRVLAIFVASIKEWRRSKVDIFWTVIFPLLMIILFGFIFGEQTTSIGLYVQDKDDTMLSQTFITTLNQTGALDLYTVPHDVDGLDYVRGKDAERLLVVPEGFQLNASSDDRNATVLMYFDETQQASVIASGVVRGVVDAFNTRGIPRIFNLDCKSIVAGEFRYVDYLIPGVVAMTVMSLGIHGSIEANTKYREKGIIKKLASTPLSKLEWILSMIVNQMFIAFISIVIIIVVGYLVFGVTVIIDIYAILLITAGSLFFPGFGMLLASFVRTPEAGGTAAEAISLPMMFLSGLFYPIEMMPEFLQQIAKVLPLTYLGQGLRDCMIHSNPAGALTNTLIIGVLAVIFIIGGSLVTRWEEE